MEDFSDGLAVVRKDGRSRYINKKGEQAFPSTFLAAGRFHKGLANVKISDAPGLPKMFISPPAYMRGTFAYIDTTGKIVFQYNTEDPSQDQEKAPK